MDCCEFRENYSDFADGLLDEVAETAARRHLNECPACRRIHAAYAAGLDALRTLPKVSPSCGFVSRLTSRLALEPPALSQWSGMAGALLVVTVVGVVAWDHFERGREGRGPEREARRPLTPPPPAGLGTFTLRQDGDTVFLSTPFSPLPVSRDSHGALYAAQLRLDQPAVWNGR